jgi:hypothetical protein
MLLVILTAGGSDSDELGATRLVAIEFVLPGPSESACSFAADSWNGVRMTTEGSAPSAMSLALKSVDGCSHFSPPSPPESSTGRRASVLTVRSREESLDSLVGCISEYVL